MRRRLQQSMMDNFAASGIRVDVLLCSDSLCLEGAPAHVALAASALQQTGCVVTTSAPCPTGSGQQITWLDLPPRRDVRTVEGARSFIAGVKDDQSVTVTLTADRVASGHTLAAGTVVTLGRTWDGRWFVTLGDAAPVYPGPSPLAVVGPLVQALGEELNALGGAQ